MTNENSFEIQFESLWLFVRAAIATAAAAIPNKFLVPDQSMVLANSHLNSLHTWIESLNVVIFNIYPLTSSIEQNK